MGYTGSCTGVPLGTRNPPIIMSLLAFLIRKAPGRTLHVLRDGAYADALDQETVMLCSNMAKLTGTRTQLLLCHTYVFKSMLICSGGETRRSEQGVETGLHGIHLGCNILTLMN